MKCKAMPGRLSGKQIVRWLVWSSLSIVGKMAAAIGHEIRNPLTTVRGYLQFFSMKKEFQTFDSQFQLMIDELDRSNNIITEFLNLAHNKAVNMVNCQLTQTIEAMYPLLQSDATIRECSLNSSFKQCLIFSPMKRKFVNSFLISHEMG